MKTAPFIFVCMLLIAGAALGQGGGIGLYVDYSAYVQCSYDDTGNALVPVFAVHKYCPGATGSGWMVTSGGGFNCAYANEVFGPPNVGTSQTGISVSYGGCRDATNLLLGTITYFCTGASPPCAYLEVVPDPAAPSGTIEVIDCSFVKLAAVGSKLYFNDDGTCGACGLPTRDTSWGQVKALYR